MSIRLKYCFFFSLQFFALTAICKPRFVDFDYELSNSKFIGLIIVNDFDSVGNIQFTSIECKDTLKSAYVGAEFKNGNLFNYVGSGILTGTLPKIGDTVLIVLNSEWKVSLFASLKEDIFRFWSPYITGSVALFSFKPPAFALTEKDKQSGNPSVKGYNDCWDGCLLSKRNLGVYKSE